jgi:zinc protease
MRKLKQYIIAGLLLVIAYQLPAQGYKLPPYEKFKLPNGLVIYLMEQHEVPLISVSAILPAGAIYDGEQAGLASLTATALKHGTQSMSKAKMDEELDFLGATISTFASKESAGLSAKFAAKDRELVLGILKDILLTPVFDTAEFTKEKKRLLVSLERQKESPRSVIGAYFDKFLYGDHVYGNIVQGKISTVTPLTAEDLKKFYAMNYRPDGSAISIAGDFNAKEMKTRLTTLFSGWKKGPKTTAANLASAPIAKPTENRVLLVNKDDAKETTFYIGAPGIARNNPDYVAVDVVNTLFGGRFTSMLNDELRVNSGLTYGANSRFSALKNGGSFIISTFTADKTTEPAIDKALEVLNKLHSTGIDEKALSSAKNYVKGQFPPRFETASELAGLMTQMFWYNFDESFINNFEKNVDGLTLDKTKEIIAKYFPKDKLQFVLVGKAADIRKIAEKYGKVKEVEIREEVKRSF